MFRTLNIARRRAIESHPAFLTSLLRPFQLNTHTIVLSKAPLLTILTNAGSAIPATAVHVPPTQTGFRPLLPVIDVLTAQVFATDPNGGLTVPIVGGEPRVFMPLAVWTSRAGRETWTPVPAKVDASVKTGDGASSASSPGMHRRTSSIGRVLSWFGAHRDKMSEL